MQYRKMGTYLPSAHAAKLCMLLYSQNILDFNAVLVYATSFRPIRKLRLFLRRYSRILQLINGIK